jgi:putative endonuclease
VNSKDLGRSGEDAAVALLLGRGYQIVGRNVRLPGGEIDVVARDGEMVVFVEVKARESRRFGTAVGAVGARKRSTLRKLAAEWFDVVAADGARLVHYKDAFR